MLWSSKKGSPTKGASHPPGILLKTFAMFDVEEYKVSRQLSAAGIEAKLERS